MNKGNTTLLGLAAQNMAQKFLVSQGLIYITKNYRSPFGEIDLIMQDHQDIVFVEVRSRSRVDYGSAADSITRGKIKKLGKTALYFMQKEKCLHFYGRFDVIAIQSTNHTPTIEWLKNAFHFRD